ncbi:hypothetical protein [Dactylosporangium sp. CA-233914]|uniref:hypothetical protein n=1 Tax=Dactylosporangium sp. CA-233914 TaxID=3239934 RepID=UPI003D8F7837
MSLSGPLDGEDLCPCGAKLDADDSTDCRKCRAWVRWQRRRTGRTHRRPGPNPSGPNL